jgi:pimeloyl-ACP methyl ester carboxylesterase/predicted glycosyltransferase
VVEMRAREPDLIGTVEVDGVTITYETFGDVGPAIVLMPTWCVVDSRAWKLQGPYLSRHFRVVTWDGPGNGGSSRPVSPDAYSAQAHVRYALSVLDAVAIDRATAVASSGGTHRTLLLAADHPERIEAVAFVGPRTHLVEDAAGEVATAFATGDLDGFLKTFMAAAFSEPHSTKAIEDGIGWGHGTTMEILRAAREADRPSDLDAYRSMCERINQPVLIVQGTDDRLTPEQHGRSLAEAIGDNAREILIEGGGHRTDLRDPVRFSVLLRDFVRSTAGRAKEARRWARSTARPPRTLFLSSPIGLGHARRDVAIARELRKLRPELEISWLAQDPVTRVLGEAGETIHPASRHLANESAHFTSESAGHDLHCFQAWRRMDELLVANFMVLHDVLEDEHYDLIVADEAWEADHFLHENPELKRGAFAWLTDFVGWLPTDDAPAADAVLTADYNAEMLEHVARYPGIRDQALFVGNPDDIVPHDFGPDLPAIRDWTEQHFAFPGYITGFAPNTLDIEQIRADLGFEPDERICIATVGGSGVGTTLLRAVIDAFPEARQKLPDLRLLVVAGPRIDPDSLGAPPDGLTVTAYVRDLYRHLAACDLAIVQGGLTTAMELTANHRPFLYFPLQQHCEQQIHVPHRLDRYGAGRRMNLATVTADDLATAIVDELDRRLDYLPVETDGAQRAAELIHELV